VNNQATITRIQLNSDVQVPGIDEKRFQEIGENAKKNCPVSRALGGVQVSLTARLV
jgi:osmotically inducible protein OsmC